jgi:NAD(P) transhydrogenase subunit alpha
MKIAVLKETFPGERRVAIVPASAAQLVKGGAEVLVERGAGAAAGFADSRYEAKGARLVDRGEALGADVIAQVRALGASPEAGQADLSRFNRGQAIVGLCDPLGSPEAVKQIASTGAALFSLEMVPRITRAQAMDVLSSMATIAGYRAVLLAAIELPKMFPLMMTAAGSLAPAKVFVIGAGVAGLQAIATARRLGGVVQAYDVRPACREQVESLGAKFVELALETKGAEGQGGYAKAMDEEFYRKQRELMASVVAQSDVVITTAAIPGKTSPVLVTAAAVAGMAPGGVIVDLAAERGGNCELSRADERVVTNGVTILGPTNLPSEAPFHASQMFSNNITRFVQHVFQKGSPFTIADDEIASETLLARDGEVVHGRVRELLGLSKLSPPSSISPPGDGLGGAALPSAAPAAPNAAATAVNEDSSDSIRIDESAENSTGEASPSKS